MRLLLICVGSGLLFVAYSGRLVAQGRYLEEGMEYVFPIKPGARGYLSGAYAELRSTHFHAGIDIRTEGKVGLEVHAVGAGYLSRVKVQELGYGKALYLRHPNGYTSVYAHLEGFQAEIEQWVVEQQYEQRGYALDLRPQPWRFPVQAAQVIAYSGNSGGSSGPHLHFELRDEAQRPLDPLSLGQFSEIMDRYPPSIRRIALRTMDIDARINGQFGRVELPVYGQSSSYHLKVPLQLSGYIGVELLAKDTYEGGKQGHSIPKLSMYKGHLSAFSYHIDTLDFALQRDIFVHMNYEQHIASERRFIKLYADEGTRLPFYQTNDHQGLLFFDEEEARQRLQIRLEDGSGNVAELKMLLNTSEREDLGAFFDAEAEYGYDIHENTLMMYLRDIPDQEIILSLASGDRQRLSPSYRYTDHNVYLWDMRRGLPVEVYKLMFDVFVHVMDLDLVAMIPSGVDYRLDSHYLGMGFTERSLYDTLYLRFEHVSARSDHSSEVFYLKNEGHPLRTKVRFELIPEDQPITSHTSVYRMDPSRVLFHETTWRDGVASFESNAFGPFTLLTDTVPPSVLRYLRGPKRWQFYVSDDLSGIDSYEARLNGAWTLLEYYPKQGMLQLYPRSNDGLPEGELVLTLRDNQKNEKSYRYYLKP